MHLRHTSVICTILCCCCLVLVFCSASPTPPTMKTSIGQFSMLDDVTLDTHGNVLVTDLQSSLHALIRMNLATGTRETLTNNGLIEPQGLVINAHDNIFVADDYANLILELCAHTCQ